MLITKTIDRGNMTLISGIIVIVISAFFTLRHYLLEKRRHDFAEFLTAVATYLIDPTNEPKKGVKPEHGNLVNVYHRFNLVFLIAPERSIFAVNEMITLLEDWSKNWKGWNDEKRIIKNKILLDKLNNIRQIFRVDLSFWQCLKKFLCS